MKVQKLPLAMVAAGLLLALQVPGNAADDGHVTLANPKTIKWGDVPPGLPKGAKAVVLDGDPAQSGLSTVRMSMPTGYKIPPHTHSRAENVTVLSGTLYYGTGEKMDTAKAQAISAGGYQHIPAEHPHYVYVKTPTVVQVHFEGPFDIRYLNPDDDPSRGQAK